MQLTKPLGTDYYDIEVYNANCEAIETAVNGKADSSHTHSYDDITDHPTAYTPTAHTHAKTDITGLDSIETTLDGKANKPTQKSVSLSSSNWSGSTAPFTQTVTVSGMTASTIGHMGIPTSITTNQYKAVERAKLHISAQGTDSLTIKAEGVKPTIAIPLVITIMG